MGKHWDVILERRVRSGYQWLAVIGFWCAMAMIAKIVTSL